MALLLCSNPLTSLPSSSSSSSLSCSSSSPPVSRLHMKPIDLHPKSFKGIHIHTPFIIKKTGSLIVKASSDIDGTGAEPSSDIKEEAESKEEVVPVNKLPLESKLQERMEQKERMKLAKKIRLRRKRLVRKRRLRKKGRWPPSKMKKLKNV
nr:50S ribosomal protein 5 alpha, chloroplastic-like [Quercus suber]POE58813.1 50s ribosomal protein 5, chloroplastic [Quercus suber]